MNQVTKNKPSYLFIMGCPRSGTTAMGTYLASHQSVVMGIERFGHRIEPSSYSMTKDLFEPERFQDIQPGDTFYESFDFAPKAYGGMEQKFEKCEYVGDKIPMLYTSLPAFFEEFGKDAYVVFMLRNIFDVAASYVARKDDPNDNWSRDIDQAINDWSLSIKAYNQSEYKDRILPVVYEDFFTSTELPAKLLGKLGLKNGEEEVNRAKNMMTRGEQLAALRPRNLSEADVLRISLRAPFGGYRALVEDARAQWELLGSDPKG